jgi:peptidoglycan/LPS O-acetylase OafA/YrhL
LFFVISGYLVSSLLYSEYREIGDVRLKRFAVRRGLKIYPSFLIFLLVSLIYDWSVRGISYKFNQIFAEIFYVQNYLRGIFSHSWSLAVEEHFYILLILVWFFVLKFKRIELIRNSIYFLLGAYLLVISTRFYMFYFTTDFHSLQKTHFRFDAILLGCMIAYASNYTHLFQYFRKYSFVILLAACVFLLPGFFWEGGSLFMNSLGLTMVNLGFALLVCFVLMKGELDLYLWKPMLYFSLIGKHSYSIYLWHLFVNGILMTFIHLPLWPYTILSISTSILVGMLFSITIEKYFLGLRESFFIKKKSN